MARVTVVGGGFGGMATAARLAKLGHSVTLCERAPRLGGALGLVEQEGFAWDTGATGTTLPAVLRDLFRKSGRPLERALELTPVTPARRHVFEDGTELDLAAGSRAAQVEAMTSALGQQAAVDWAEYVDSLAPVWDLLRRRVLENPFPGCTALDRETQRRLDPRRSLGRVVRRAFRDPRLQTLLQHHVVMQGSEPRDTPWFLAVESYVERTFGVWRPVGGMHALTTALCTRLEERGVDVRPATEVTEIACVDGAVRTVALSAGSSLDADVVVGAIDPRRLFRLLVDCPQARRPLRDVDRAVPAIPTTLTYLGLTDEAPSLPAETVLHSEATTLVVRTGGQAPPGHVGWTVQRRGNFEEDVPLALARRGIDVREHVVTRLDRSPADIVGDSDGSPFGVRWAGPRTATWRPNNRTPVGGLYCVGASAHPGPGVPLVGLGAALVAELVGRA
ncbi:MAG: phytoene desaturase family protein [Nocardioidaceae bacterium]